VLGTPPHLREESAGQRLGRENMFPTILQNRRRRKIAWPMHNVNTKLRIYFSGRWLGVDTKAVLVRNFWAYGSWRVETTPVFKETTRDAYK
jgi:hypothetical protein